MADPEYKQRYCAFVDILGFRGLIDRINKGELSAAKLKEILDLVHRPIRGIVSPDTQQTSDLRAQSISDAVAISAAPNPTGLKHLFWVLENLALGLLEEGYLLRGAIAKGALYHDDQMVFGQAFNDAYRLESSVARYPRVMIAGEVVEDTRDSPLLYGFNQHIRQAEDGPYYLHVLRLIEVEIGIALREDHNVDPAEHHDLAYCVIAGGFLQKRLKDAVDDPEIFEKVRWFANYWNDILPPGHPHFRPVEGPGLDISKRMPG